MSMPKTLLSAFELIDYLLEFVIHPENCQTQKRAPMDLFFC
jgi:hypothetical protein